MQHGIQMQGSSLIGVRVCGGDDNVSVIALVDSPSRAAVLGSADLLPLILTFVSAADLLPSSRVCRDWVAAAQLVVRERARGLLRATLASSSTCDATLASSKSVAAATEAALFAGCGRRAGPGAYNARLRALLFGLASNAGLRDDAMGGRIAAAALVALPADRMRNAARAAEDARILAEAARAAVKAPPRPHLEGVYRCDCGCARQWVRRHCRNLEDVTKFSEVLVCCDCLAVVAPTARIGGGGGTAAEAVEAGSGGGEEEEEEAVGEGPLSARATVDDERGGDGESAGKDERDVDDGGDVGWRPRLPAAVRATGFALR